MDIRGDIWLLGKKTCSLFWKDFSFLAISQSLFGVNWNQNGANISEWCFEYHKGYQFQFSCIPWYELWDHKYISHRSSSSRMHHHHQFVSVVLWRWANCPYPIHLILWGSSCTLERCNVVQYNVGQIFSHDSFLYIWFYEQWLRMSYVRYNADFMSESHIREVWCEQVEWIMCTWNMCHTLW